jgi:hypothetical protein
VRRRYPAGRWAGILTARSFAEGIRSQAIAA